jgi:quercetin dioxygenase-like cupin family protein
MANRKIRVIGPKDRVKVTLGAGDEYRYLATGRDTDNQYFLVEATVPPGGGPPSHIQTQEEEAFYILEGELTFYGEDGEIEAGPGTYLNIPKGAKHRFRNNGEQTAKMLFFFVPSGIEALFDALAEMDEPQGDFSAVINALNKLGKASGVEYLNE